MKHILKKSCLVVGCILLLACGRSPEFFIGKWQILSVVEDDQVMDLHENWIHLKEDGTFPVTMGRSKSQKLESGYLTIVQMNYSLMERVIVKIATGY